MRWMAARAAPCPATGGHGLTLPFIAVTAPPAITSLAARTPSTLSLRLARAVCISALAASSFPPGVSCCAPSLTLPLRTLAAASLKVLLLGSAASPSSSTIVGLTLLPIAVTSALASSAPAASVSNDTK